MSVQDGNWNSDGSLLSGWLWLVLDIRAERVQTVGAPWGTFPPHPEQGYQTLVNVQHV